MIPKHGNKYRKEFLLKETDKTKLTWQFILVFISFSLYLLFSLIAPILPSKYNNHFPVSMQDYWRQVKAGAIGISFLFLGVILCVFISEIRRRIDIFFGFKRIGIFYVIRIYNLGTFKIIRFNNGHFLSMKQANENFYTIQIGNIFEIERTATYKLTTYKILESESL